MEYFESDVPPSDGCCSDNACPCPETPIRRGEGYLYIEQSLVDFRSKYPRLEDAERAKRAELDQARARSGLQGGVVFRLGPILVCERGAQLRKLDLVTAAADAAHWWATGQVPLRATLLSHAQTDTPSAAQVERTIEQNHAQTRQEAFSETVKDQLADRMASDMMRTLKQDNRNKALHFLGAEKSRLAAQKLSDGDICKHLQDIVNRAAEGRAQLPKDSSTLYPRKLIGSGGAELAVHLGDDDVEWLSSMIPQIKAAQASGCFIATVCYGDYDAREVRILRRFRDETLLKSPGGCSAVETYYRLSPPFARWLGRHPLMARTIRASLLNPMIRLVSTREK